MSEPSGSDSSYDLYQELGLPVELIDPNPMQSFAILSCSLKTLPRAEQRSRFDGVSPAADNGLLKLIAEVSYSLKGLL